MRYEAQRDDPRPQQMLHVIPGHHNNMTYGSLCRQFHLGKSGVPHHRVVSLIPKRIAEVIQCHVRVRGDEGAVDA